MLKTLPTIKPQVPNTTIQSLSKAVSVKEIEKVWKQCLRERSILRSQGLRKKAFLTRIRGLLSIAIKEENSSVKIFNKTCGAINGMRTRFIGDEDVVRQCQNLQTEVTFLRNLFQNPSELNVVLSTDLDQLRSSAKSVLKNKKASQRIFEVFVLQQESLEIKLMNLNALFVRLALLLQTESLIQILKVIKEENLMPLSQQEKQILLQQVTYSLAGSIKLEFSHDTQDGQLMEKYNSYLEFILSSCEREEFNARALSNLIGYTQMIKFFKTGESSTMNELILSLLVDMNVISSINLKEIKEQDLIKFSRAFLLLTTGLDQHNFKAFASAFISFLKTTDDTQIVNHEVYRRLFDVICFLAPKLNEQQKELCSSIVHTLLEKLDVKELDKRASGLGIKVLLYLGKNGNCIDFLSNCQPTQNIQSLHHMLDYFNERRCHEGVLQLTQQMQFLNIFPSNITVDKIAQSFFAEAVATKNVDKVYEGIGFIISLCKLNNINVHQLTRERVEYVTTYFDIDDAYKQFLYDIDFKYESEEVDEDFLN